MIAKIESLEIKGITIKKHTNVEIDVWGDGRTMTVTVLDITLKGSEIEIESITSLGSIIHHSAEQWEEMLVRKV